MTSRNTPIEIISTGQFDDADNDATVTPIQAWTIPAQPVASTALEAAPVFDVREGRKLIDDEAERAALEWSDEEEENVNEDDEDDEYFDEIQVDDEDWEISERGAFSCT